MSSFQIHQLDNYINGQRRAPISGNYMENKNPATGEVISQLPLSNRFDVDVAVEAAKNALNGIWKEKTSKERIEYCKSFSRLLIEKLDSLALAESKDTGKPLQLASTLDIPRSAYNFEFFAEYYQHFNSPTSLMDSGINYTCRKPVGVVGLISPWNLPLYLLTWKIAPALIMGNTIIAKPSELTPTTASLLANIADEIRLPPGVLNILHGKGNQVGQAILEHPDINAISFTGGTSTGAIVAETAAKTFKKVSLELGGKNPTVIFEDSDIETAVESAIKSSFTNSGQICLCGSRILVQSSIYDEFLEKFIIKTKNIKVGSPLDKETHVGSLISIEHLKKIEKYIQLAKDEGGKILCGGERAKIDGIYSNGAFFYPTIITNLDTNSRVVQEEIFGPVVTVHKFIDEEDALEQSNSVKYGLSASVWTNDLQKAHRFSEKLEVGMVWVNSWMVRDLRTPFGGVKSSGMGREGGPYSLEFFSTTKNVYINLSKPSFTPCTRLKTTATTITTKSTHSMDNISKKIEEDKETIDVPNAPKPVGAYPHAKRHGDLLFLSGIGPRCPKTNEIPGGPIKDFISKQPLDYDIQAQTEAVIQNVRCILEASGSSFDKIIDIQVFLINMDRDFEQFNQVYNQHFKTIKATRTTCSIKALPTPIAVEFKVIAKA